MGRILIVDDEPGVLRGLERALAKRGWEVVSESSAERALALVKDTSPDVVISDYLMPEMRGDELLNRLEERHPDAIGILLTGCGDWGVAKDGVNRGHAFRLLEKPWEEGEVARVVGEAFAALERRRKHSAHLRLLENEVAQRTDQVLQTLVEVLDLRDSETQWHSRRVSLFSRRLAEAIGVGAGDDLESIERGSLLHDIGKIGVRDAVLLKPGPLNAEEWMEMRRHPALGHQLLSKIGFLSAAAEIVLSHHERFDGRGYPRGLSGKQICLGARIFSIVDAYDAITSDRPYRRGRTHEVALEEIRRYTATQFDPEIVAVFEDIPATEWSDIREAVEHYSRAARRARL
jgi:putative nucleotidyltransferase with HDIG domain